MFDTLENHKYLIKLQIIIIVIIILSNYRNTDFKCLTGTFFFYREICFQYL